MLEGLIENRCKLEGGSSRSVEGLQRESIFDAEFLSKVFFGTFLSHWLPLSL